MQLARKLQRSDLTGVVWHGRAFLETRYRGFLSSEVISTLRTRDAEILSEIRSDFDERIFAEGLQGQSSFLDLDGGSDSSLAECARAYDIVVMGNRAAAFGREHFEARPDVVALRSGRPLVLVQKDYLPAEINEHAVIAWDGKRAAARALGDALQILDTKSKVTVLTVGNTRIRPSASDIIVLLRRHGIEAEAFARPASRGGVAQTLMEVCKEIGAGLLVMGAYEHSKFSEDILGGVTQDIFNEAHLPVLMSH